MHHKHSQNIINAEIQGVLLLDKPQGLISQKALQKVKSMLGANRAGHIGTLDPLASGLLPIVFGDATRYAFGWECADKIYTATITLGGASNTDDAQGEITPVAIPNNINERVLIQALQKQLGHIWQMPPLYSAVRVEGKKLYKWARQELARKANNQDTKSLPLRQQRQVFIEQINLIAWHQESHKVDIQVHCGSGTYIRAIARDLGQELGSAGYLSAIRRIGFGGSSIDDAIIIDMKDNENSDTNNINRQILMSALQPTEVLLQAYPIVHLNDMQAYRLYCGQKLRLINCSNNQHISNNSVEAVNMAINYQYPGGNLPTTAAPSHHLISRRAHLPTLRLYHQGRFLGMGKIKTIAADKTIDESIDKKAMDKNIRKYNIVAGNYLCAGRMMPQVSAPKNPLI